jgi:hypothetical protein
MGFKLPIHKEETESRLRLRPGRAGRGAADEVAALSLSLPFCPLIRD